MSEPATFSDEQELTVIDVLVAVRRTQGRCGVPRWSMARDIEDALARWPAKLVTDKLKWLLDNSLLFGCTCGCRGDFEFTQAGIMNLPDEWRIGTTYDDGGGDLIWPDGAHPDALNAMAAADQAAASTARAASADG